jgi:hypothetical protein
VEEMEETKMAVTRNAELLTKNARRPVGTTGKARIAQEYTGPSVLGLWKIVYKLV